MKWTFFLTKTVYDVQDPLQKASFVLPTDAFKTEAERSFTSGPPGAFRGLPALAPDQQSSEGCVQHRLYAEKTRRLDKEDLAEHASAHRTQYDVFTKDAGPRRAVVEFVTGSECEM